MHGKQEQERLGGGENFNAYGPSNFDSQYHQYVLQHQKLQQINGSSHARQFFPIPDSKQLMQRLNPFWSSCCSRSKTGDPGGGGGLLRSSSCCATIKQCWKSGACQDFVQCWVKGCCRLCDCCLRVAGVLLVTLALLIQTLASYVFLHYAVPEMHGFCFVHHADHEHEEDEVEEKLQQWLVGAFFLFVLGNAVWNHMAAVCLSPGHPPAHSTQMRTEELTEILGNNYNNYVHRVGGEQCSWKTPGGGRGGVEEGQHWWTSAGSSGTNSNRDINAYPYNNHQGDSRDVVCTPATTSAYSSSQQQFQFYEDPPQVNERTTSTPGMNNETTSSCSPATSTSPDHNYYSDTSMFFPRICRRCDRWKPERAHHCSVCGQCVLKMDHHCPWINNCVGFGNYRHFCCFLFWLYIETWVILISCYAQFAEVMIYYRSRHDTFEARQFVCFLYVIAAAVSLAILVLGSFHLYLVLTNQTTIEWQMAFGGLDDDEEEPNPYHLGTKCLNFKQVFGDRGVVLGLLPWLAEGSFKPKGRKVSEGLSFPRTTRFCV
ncbi:unnamed protein product [Amoebophrya sp. A25]|nr:unnamed protein product [Amoebophrya sp. A25]|eukprot:GSA25T00020668001.1